MNKSLLMIDDIPAMSSWKRLFTTILPHGFPVLGENKGAHPTCNEGVKVNVFKTMDS